ncbi:MAG TPA: DUF4124 domain-containing protein [Steroidobacteraceae bacterium]|nr:DUF4124 domain-containing protein [Steroidobacteraceae bacterium]
MRAFLFTLISAALFTTAAATTVYKWVDDNGVVHYSDQPHENAQKVQLKAPQTYSAPKIDEDVSSPTRPAQPGPAYKSCQISQPTNDQMFTNTATVTAGVNLQPAARPGDQLVVTLDGQRVPGVPPEGGPFTISPVDRGTHSLQAIVQDSRGQAVCQSQSVTFHVRQPSAVTPGAAVPTAPGVPTAPTVPGVPRPRG